jgi:DNA invertase Pin-like site-specific DNA recombinase
MKVLKTGDHVIASEISRLGRELFMVFRILEFFTTKGILLDTVKDNYHLDGSITSKVLAFAFSMAAQIERDMISKRTKEGLEARRRQGVLIGRPIGAISKTKKLDEKEKQIKELLQKNISYAGIARILHVHRLTVSRLVKERGWDCYLSDKRRAGNEKMNKKMNAQLRVKSFRRIKDLKLDELLDLYREKKGLAKVAESLGVTTACLKTYIVKNNMWDDLIATDNQMRLENPSINQEAKIYGIK